jgi:predicted double-glycine peptidase
MIDLPNLRQTFNYDCGAKAMQIVMAYYGVDVREDELISHLSCHPEGTSITNMIKVAEEYGFQVEATTGTSLSDLKKYLEEGFPVIILLQAWAEKSMTRDDWRVDEKDGHYVIAIDYKDDRIIFEDPSSFHRTWLGLDELDVRWHDVDPKTHQKFDHFAMVMKGKQPVTRTIEHMN